MLLPFSESQVLDVMRRYNEDVWPAQAVLLALGILAVMRAARGGVAGSRQAAAILALLWAWMALAYHLAFFRAINVIAPVFTVAFLVQAALRSGRVAWKHDVRPSR